jgi:hypothetical protein
MPVTRKELLERVWGLEPATLAHIRRFNYGIEPEKRVRRRRAKQGRYATYKSYSEAEVEIIESLIGYITVHGLRPEMAFKRYLAERRTDDWPQKKAELDQARVTKSYERELGAASGLLDGLVDKTRYMRGLLGEDKYEEVLRDLRDESSPSLRHILNYLESER